MLKSKFIKDILTLLLDGDKEGIKIKRQLEFITETEFKYTGMGVFVIFKQENGIENYKSTNNKLLLNGVTINSPELKIGANSNLFIKDGFIDYLEIWSNDGEYPHHDLKEYELKQDWKGSSGFSIERKN
jgi:hypothetical protein